MQADATECKPQNVSDNHIAVVCAYTSPCKISCNTFNVYQTAIGVIVAAIGVIAPATCVIAPALGVIVPATCVIAPALGVIAPATCVIAPALGVITLSKNEMAIANSGLHQWLGLGLISKRQ